MSTVSLVTGANQGLGFETARRLVAAGHHVLVGARSEAKAAEAARRRGSAAEGLVLDVTSPADHARAAARIAERHGRLDVLVNNAGVNLGEPWMGNTVLSGDDATLRATFDTNFFGLVGLTRALVPLLRRSSAGRVVNVSSVLGFFATPDTLGYSTAKFGVFGFSEAMRGELRPHGIGVSTICPGVTNTPIVKTGRYRTSGDTEKIRERTMNGFARFGRAPEMVAHAIERAVIEGRDVVPAAPEAWAFWYAKRWLPKTFERTASWLAARAKAR